jgi:hypothetical protein
MRGGDRTRWLATLAKRTGRASRGPVLPCHPPIIHYVDLRWLFTSFVISNIDT